MRRSRVLIVVAAVAVAAAGGGLAVWWSGSGFPGSGGFGGPRGSYTGSESVRAVLRATPDFDRQFRFEVHYADHRALRAVGVVPGSPPAGGQLHPSRLLEQTRSRTRGHGNDPGFEFAELDSTLELHSRAASWSSLSFLRGQFDRERLGAILEARGSAVPHALGTVWCGALGCGGRANLWEWGLISPMYGGDIGAQWPVALRDDVMIVTRTFEVLEGALRAVAGRGTSLGERPEVAALLDGLDGGWEVRQLFVPLDAGAVGSYPDGAVALALADVASSTQEWGLLVAVFDTSAAADRFSANVSEYFAVGDRAGTSWGSAISELGGVLRVDAPVSRGELFVVRVGLERVRGEGSEQSDVAPAELYTLLVGGLRVGMPWVAP